MSGSAPNFQGGIIGEGGGGLHFRSPPDVFANAAARTAYFGLTVNATVYLEFAKDKSLAIIIGTIANPTGFQTYTGDPADSYADAKWLDRTDAVQSVTPGSQGIYERSIHRNSSVIISVAPVGGSINVETAIVTPPADWTFNPTAPLVGEDTYRSRVSINPDNQSGDIVPIWSLPIDIRGSVNVADIDARISGPALANNPVGTFDNLRIPSGIARDTEVAAAIAGIMASGAINLGIVTPTSDRLTAVAPSGYSRYPKGTLLLFKASYGQLDSSWTGSLNFYIGTDHYNLYGDGTSDITYGDLVADTYYLAVVDTAVQILGPVKVPGSITIDEVLAKILQGAGIGIDTSVDGQITLSAGVVGGRSDGTLSDIVMDSSAQTIKFTSTLGTPITLDVSDLVTEAELAAYVKTALAAIIVVTPGTHTRRSAISIDEILSQAEFDAGVPSNNQDITMPTWSGGRRYLYIGIPEAEGDLTGVSSGGIGIFPAFERVTGIIFAHKWWKTINSQSDVASGVTYQITEV